MGKDRVSESAAVELVWKFIHKGNCCCKSHGTRWMHVFLTAEMNKEQIGEIREMYINPNACGVEEYLSSRVMRRRFAS